MMLPLENHFFEMKILNLDNDDNDGCCGEVQVISSDDNELTSLEMKKKKKTKTKKTKTKKRKNKDESNFDNDEMHDRPSEENQLNANDTLSLEYQKKTKKSKNKNGKHFENDEHDEMHVRPSERDEFFGKTSSSLKKQANDSLLEEQNKNCLLYTSPSPRDRG